MKNLINAAAFIRGNTVFVESLFIVMKHFTKVTDYGIDLNVMEKSRNCFPLFVCESCVHCLSYF